MATLSFEDGVARNRAGTGFAFTSACSAHPDVLAASLHHFGYADRIRHYWADPEVRAAVAAIRLRGEGLGLAKSLIHAKIESALAPYLEVIR